MMKTLLLLLITTFLVFGAETMHPKTYEAINEANKHIQEKEYEKAHRLFSNLLENTSKKRAYDLAFIYNAIAYLNIQEGIYKDAIKAYEKVLSFDVLPAEMRNNIIYSLAQLSLQEELYKQSIDYLQKWHEINRPTLSSAKLMMVNFLSLQNSSEALKWCKKAISLGTKPKLALYQNQLALQLNLDKTDEAILTLEFMISNFAITKSYFTQLSYLYQSKGDDKKSVAILESAYQLGVLTSYKEKLQLAQMFNYTDATQKAIQVVETLADDTNHTVETLEYLAQLQLAAKEYKDAVKNLQKLYEVEKKSKTALLLAQLFASEANWEACEEYATFVKSSEANILLAIALAEQKKFTKAREVFTTLLEDKEFKSQAKMWLDYISN